MKDELGRKLMKFVTLTPKVNNYLTHDGRDNEKTKDTSKCLSNLNLKVKKMIRS